MREVRAPLAFNSEVIATYPATFLELSSLDGTNNNDDSDENPYNFDLKGTGTETLINIPSEPNNWELQGTVDFDGNGKADILWRDPLTGENALWLMDGVTNPASDLISED